jgi:hypothetical protein
MVKKAQAEFIVIVGILLLSLVVIYYAMAGGIQSSSVPSGVYDKQSQVQQSFMNMARKGFDKTLAAMEAHGGYPTAELLGEGSYESPQFTIFMAQGVPYWTRCEQNMAPSKSDVQKWFELSMENYIRQSIGEMESKYRNVSFDLSKLSVSVNILSNPRKIDLDVTLPTKVDGYSMSSNLPYKASIDTKFGEIYDFASDFSKAQVSKRFLEVFTTASVYMSKDAEDGYPKLPTGGVLTNCGQTIYRSPEQVSAYLKEIAEYVITQTIWWQGMPVDPSKPKVYAINNELLGREYRDLEIGMYLPDGFQFETSQPVVITNAQPAYTSAFWTASKCLGTYSMGYSVSYPVIVRVKDTPSGHSFNFASMVFVDYAETSDKVDIDGSRKNVIKMTPGKCEKIQSGQDSCANPGCYAGIQVVDEKGSSLSGVVVTYGGCGLGSSDSFGKIEGKIKCGVHELSLFKNSSYDYFSQNVSSQTINNTYTLRSIPAFNAHFRKIAMTEECAVVGDEGNYNTVTYPACDSTSSMCVPGSQKITRCLVENLTDYAQVEFYGNRQYVISNLNSSLDAGCLGMPECQSCQNSGDAAACSSCITHCVNGFVDNNAVKYMPTGSYLVNESVTNLGSMKETGGALFSYTLSTQPELYFNIPRAPYQDQYEYGLSDSMKTCLREKLASCQIQPISTEEPKSRLITSCGCSNLKNVMVEKFSACLSQADIDSLTCTCPSGAAGYPAGCSSQCGDDVLPCSVCCSPEAIKQILLSKCNTYVICQ